MTEVRVTFTMEASDPDHSTGLTTEDYELMHQLVAEAGGYDIEEVVVDDDT